MNVKTKIMQKDWVEPDDAHVYIGDILIKRCVARPPIKNTKEILSLSLDADILEKLRVSDKGWQTRLSNHI